MIIVSNNNSSAFNLAAEKYLFYENKEDILFLYVNDNSVIVGANQVLSNEVNLDFCKKNNISVQRRMSGGGAVFHDFGNLNYCFIKCLESDKNPLNNDFLQPIIDVMKTFSVPLTIGKRHDLWLPNGFKVGGTASLVRKKRILQHGTLLFDTDLEKLHKSLTVSVKNNTLKGVVSVPSPVKNIKTYLLENNLPVLESKRFFKDFTEKISVYFQFEPLYFSSSEINKITTFIEEK